MPFDLTDISINYRVWKTVYVENRSNFCSVRNLCNHFFLCVLHPDQNLSITVLSMLQIPNAIYAVDLHRAVHKNTGNQILFFVRFRSNWWETSHYWDNFTFPWICVSTQKIRLFHYVLWQHWSHLVLRHAYRNIFQSTFNFQEFVSTCKKSDHFIIFFKR